MIKKYHVSKNLFDKDNANYFNGYYDYSNNKIASYSTNRMFYIPIEQGKTYTISGIIRYNMNITQRYVLTTNAPVSGEVPVRSFAKNVSAALTFTAENNENYLCVMICGDSDYTGYGSVDNALAANTANIMFNTGSTPLPYEPYSSEAWHTIPYRKYGTEADTITTLPKTIIADGTSATATIKGNLSQSGTPTPSSPIYPSEVGNKTANLFNKNGEVLAGNGSAVNIIATGIKTIVQSQGGNRYSTLKLDNELLGKTITITANITQSASNKGQIRLFYVNGRYATSSITAITTAGQTGYITRTYTMPSSIPSGSDGIAIVLSADRDGDGDVGDYVEYADLMIVEGSTAPSEYIPYGYKIPILSGGTTTPVYLGEVQSERQIKKLVLTGQEDWVNAGNAGHSWRIEPSDIKRSSSQTVVADIICSHYSATQFNTVYNGRDTGIGVPSTANWIAICDLNISSVSDFTQYLAGQYSAGTPVTVWYVLATPTTGIVNEPLRKIGTYADSISNVASIPTSSGSQTFDVDTTLKPSEVDLTYHGWHEHSDKKYSGGSWTE